MEELLEIFNISKAMDQTLMQQQQEFLLKIHSLLNGPDLPPTAASALNINQLQSASPQQTKKRAKRLTSLNEEEAEKIQAEASEKNCSARSGNAELLTQMDVMEEDVEEHSAAPMPAPRAITTGPAEQQPDAAVGLPAQAEPVVKEHEFLRPQRAAKLKSEKNLKEVSMRVKLRRPSSSDNSVDVKVKQEHEQRQSQMINSSTASARSKQSTASTKSDASLLIMPEKATSIVELLSEVEQDDETQLNNVEKPKKKSDGLEETKSVVSDKRLPRVVIKREKLSGDSTTIMPAPVPGNDANIETTLEVPMPKKLLKREPIASDESAQHSNTTNNTNSTVNASTAVPAKKKGKKKKDIEHRPIKVERFSELDVQPSPISSRTRHGSVGRAQRPASIYEDAVDQPAVELAKAAHADTPPSRVSQVPDEVYIAASAIATGSTKVNETVTMPSATAQGNQSNATFAAGDTTFTAPNPAQTTFQVAAAGQTTFVMDNPNATVTIAAKQPSDNADSDATFNIAPQRNTRSKDNQSMVTAKDSSNPAEDSLITEDESYKSPQLPVLLPPPQAPKPTALKAPSSAKTYKMPSRTNELFNPLVQSPVKKKVEAFEAAAVQQSKPNRPKRTKENLLPTTQSSSSNTPLAGKLAIPALGRFLTPTQGSNITPNATLQTKKLASSASKAVPFPKANTNLKKAPNSASAKTTLSRENSGDDFRRGIHQLAEDRKKLREQKHLLAAQQREAKEKERAERMVKLAKERNEKRLKRQAELEQKKKAMDDIQQKLRQQDELDKQKQTQSAKAKDIQEQERDLLQQMKPPKSQQFVQPAPKSRNKYIFEMLHEDDSTDDECKVTYKRPAPPIWSRSSVRGPAIHLQQTFPTDVIDSFFSVQPMTPDLKLIFPNIDERHLKRNSSAFWSTPPRYSELPKY